MMVSRFFCSNSCTLTTQGGGGVPEGCWDGRQDWEGCDLTSAVLVEDDKGTNDARNPSKAGEDGNDQNGSAAAIVHRKGRQQQTHKDTTQTHERKLGSMPRTFIR